VTLLDRAVERRPLAGHDGRSGASLERVVLDDGTPLVVKRTSPRSDLVLRRTGGAVSREYRLWQAGVLHALPAGVGHALVDAWQEGDKTVLVMRDLGDAVVGWSRRISREECRRLFGALAALHRAFAGSRPAGLCPLATRVALFAPARMAGPAAEGAALPRAVLQGWERFAEVVDDEVAGAVLGVLDRPEQLAGPLSRLPSTLIHGDPWLVNVALEPSEVVLLDWDLATWGPPELDLAYFLDGNWSRVDACRDELIDDFSSLSGRHGDETALELALFAGLVNLGWNKALDVADPAERADLEWWVCKARRALEHGLLDLA
jgi:hypothetical protein